MATKEEKKAAKEVPTKEAESRLHQTKRGKEQFRKALTATKSQKVTYKAQSAGFFYFC